jgi:hypothetical protein
MTWDSNPRWLITTPLFESGTINHSDTSPRASIPAALGPFGSPGSPVDASVQWPAERSPSLVEGAALEMRYTG